MAKVSYVTEEGLLRLKDELDQLKRVETSFHFTPDSRSPR